MAMSRAIEVLYQNQMQFNLGVPLTSSNLASHYHKPCPIMVERVGGQNTIPGRSQNMHPAPENPNVSATSSNNYSMISEDRMAQVSQLAKRDLKNRQIQLQRARAKSPSAESIVSTKTRQSRPCANQRRLPVNKPRTPLRAKEADKNRRVGNIQTPPPRKPKPTLSHGDGNDSLYSHPGVAEVSKDNDSFFPAKPSVPSNVTAAPKDEIGKLQLELEGYLQTLCRIEQQVIRDGSTEFLQHRVKGKIKDNFLSEEVDLDRVRVRAGEHKTRSARNLYNLCQKVKQLQREVTQGDLTKPTKKSQVATQLNATYRGAVRALQMFVNQLPYQDIQMGLPSAYNELALLLRQLTTLTTLTQQGAKVDAPDNVLNLLDQVDDYNSRWCTMALQQNRAGQQYHDKRAGYRNAAPHKAWVSDTKVEDSLFSKPRAEYFPMKKQQAAKKSGRAGRGVMTTRPQQLKERRSKVEKNAMGKENKLGPFREGPKPSTTVSSAALTGQKVFGLVPVESRRPHQSSKAVVQEIDWGKGYMLPSDLMAKRERAQRAVELSKKNFAESTMSSRLKTSSPCRPSSAPSPGRRKEVNFDLGEDSKPPLPWIPAGSGHSRPRSSSAERIPFYVKTLEGQYVSRNDAPTRFASSHAAGQDRQREAAFGFRSLPTQGQLRSCDVSDSFVDEIEKRILYRMLQKRGQTRAMEERKDQILYSSNEALDITDLTVDPSYNSGGDSLNVTAEAATMVDAPTLENIRLKLANMERTKREIRHRWSSLKFIDTRPDSRYLINDCPEDPPAINLDRVTTSSTDHNGHHNQPQSQSRPCDALNKDWSEEPLLFTKPKARSNTHYLHTLPDPRTTNHLLLPGTQEVTVNQETVGRILEDRDRFADHLRKRSHHPTGKFDPWALVEEISEEILATCLQEVSEEMETVSEEIANQMYRSEFMVTGRPSETDLLDLEFGLDQGHGQSQYQLHQTTRVDFERKKGGDDSRLGYGGDGDLFSGKHQGLDFGGVGMHDDMMGGKSSPLLLGVESPRDIGFEPAPGIAAEPLLDNVSQLVQEKVEGLIDSPTDKGDDENESEEYEYDEEDEDDDDDNDDDDDGDEVDGVEEEEDYSEEFENVSDVEL